MPTVPELDIRAADEHAYEVAITHTSGARTEHRVTVPDARMTRLGASAAQEPLIVRASLTYLLERSPAALPDHFDLEEIGRAIPEYEEEIVDRY